MIAQLQGFEAAAGAWEREILPARVTGYDSAWLDALCLVGRRDVGPARRAPAGGTPSRAAPIALVRRADLRAGCWRPTRRRRADDAALSAPARDVLAFLGRAGASFLDELIAGTRRLRAEVEDALGELVVRGPRHRRRVLGSARADLGDPDRGGARARWHARWNRRAGGAVGAGRWSLLRASRRRGAPTTARAARWPTRPGTSRSRASTSSATASCSAICWRARRRRRRGATWCASTGASRCAASCAAGAWSAASSASSSRCPRRSTRCAPPAASRTRGEIVRLSACDPLNLVGIITPGPRIAASHATPSAIEDGVPQPAASSSEATQRPALSAHAAW